jgi:hypothetical protein
MVDMHAIAKKNVFIEATLKRITAGAQNFFATGRYGVSRLARTIQTIARETREKTRKRK